MQNIVYMAESPVKIYVRAYSNNKSLESELHVGNIKEKLWLCGIDTTVIHMDLTEI
jgi:hypothetical protein